MLLTLSDWHCDYEDNDTQATAAAITVGTHTGLRVCGEDDDYYRFDLAGDDVLSVRWDFSGTEGGIDLVLLDEFGTSVEDSRTTYPDIESITYTALVAGTYAIRVYLYRDYGSVDGSDYEMTITHTP